MNSDITFIILSFFHIREIAKYFSISQSFFASDNNILWKMLSLRDLGIETNKETFKKYRKFSDDHMKQIITIFDNNPKCIAIDMEILFNKRIIDNKIEEPIIYDSLYDKKTIRNKLIFDMLFNPEKNNKKVLKKYLNKHLYFVKRDGKIIKVKNNNINFYSSIFIFLLYHSLEDIKNLKLKKEYDNYFVNLNKLKQRLYKSLIN